MDRFIDYVTSLLEKDVERWVVGCLGVGALALIVSWVLHRRLAAMDAGDHRVRKIGDAIRTGAGAFLRAQYAMLAVFAAATAAVLAFALDERGHGLTTAVCFLCGCACSALSCVLGMRTATAANVRTAQAAAAGGLGPAFRTAFRSGAVTGFLVVGSGTAGIAALYLWLGDPDLLFGFALGASSIALFARVGGGIYTKAADVGADLVGRLEAGIPEDDPRNPAAIADHVGDNVGDVAGTGADLFESHVGATLAAMSLGLAAVAAARSAGAAAVVEGLPLGASTLVLAPLVLAAVGVLASMAGHFVVKTEDERKVASTLSNGVVVASVLAAIGAMVVTVQLDLNKQEVTQALTGWKQGVASQTAYGGPYGVLVAALAGILAGVAIGKLTERYTWADHRHVRAIADRSAEGAAPNVIHGLAVGMLSTAWPAVALVLATGIAFWAAGTYGFGIAAVGMLSTLGISLAADAFAPVADNAGGVAEMARLPSAARRVTDALDAAGKAAASVGRGFAVGAAALTTLALFAVFATRYRQLHGVPLALDLKDVRVTMGLLLGAMLPFLFSSFALRAVGRAAAAMADEVRRQFREIRGLMDGSEEPDYGSCVRIAAQGALRQTLAPALLAVAAPIAVGLSPLGPSGLGGLLIGATASGVMLALFLTNAGGAWDNAKSYVETGLHGGKGSAAHKAAVTGDTVGDPLKDTAGPSLDVLLEVMTLVSLVGLPLFGV